MTVSLQKKLCVNMMLIGMGFLSVLSHSAVTLMVDDHIKVTAINGQEVKQSAFRPLTKTFSLQPGQHVITAKYDRFYDLPRDEHEYLRSGNISVAANLIDNQTYRLTMPNQPEDYATAKEYASHPTLAIEQGNTVVVSQQSNTDNDGGLFSGLGKAISGVFGGSGNAALQNQNTIAALEQSAGGEYSDASAATATITGTTAPQSANTLDGFMQIWLRATPAEREKMRQWMQK